jgi:hypothetical protein
MTLGRMDDGRPEAKWDRHGPAPALTPPLVECDELRVLIRMGEERVHTARARHGECPWAFGEREGSDLCNPHQDDSLPPPPSGPIGEDRSSFCSKSMPTGLAGAARHPRVG